jgi:tetratricopeptide (TPR) repeat protein
LKSRNNLANALHAQGKNNEAEQEHRAVIKVRERVLGAEHPDVARSCYNLALCLKAQQKLPEALAFMQRAEQVRTQALGPEHPDTKFAKAGRKRLEPAAKGK